MQVALSKIRGKHRKEVTAANNKAMELRARDTVDKLVVSQVGSLLDSNHNMVVSHNKDTEGSTGNNREHRSRDTVIIHTVVDKMVMDNNNIVIKVTAEGMVVIRTSSSSSNTVNTANNISNYQLHHLVGKGKSHNTEVLHNHK